MNLKKILALVFCVSIFLTRSSSAMEILATTATETNPWSLSIVKTDDGDYGFLILNYQTEQAGLVQYNRDIYNFYLNKGQYGYSPLIFIMAVKDSPKDIDTDLGEWREGMHLLPIYAPFDYSNGQVILESYVSSCNGLSASHYQGRIQSPYHIKLAEIFLTHMPALHRAVESGGVVLP